MRIGVAETMEGLEELNRTDLWTCDGCGKSVAKKDARYRVVGNGTANRALLVACSSPCAIEAALKLKRAVTTCR